MKGKLKRPWTAGEDAACCGIWAKVTVELALSDLRQSSLHFSCCHRGQRREGAFRSRRYSHDGRPFLRRVCIKKTLCRRRICKAEFNFGLLIDKESPGQLSGRGSSRRADHEGRLIRFTPFSEGCSDKSPGTRGIRRGSFHRARRGMQPPNQQSPGTATRCSAAA